MTNAVFAEDEVDLEKELQEAETQAAETTEAENEVETETAAEEAETETEKESEKESPRVPLAELQAERKRRQEFQRRVEEYESSQKKLEERFAELAKKLEPEEPEVSFEENPAEWLKQQAQRTNQTVEQLREQFTQNHQYTQQQQEQAFLANRVIASEDAFRKTAPDYDDAVTFLREKRALEYQAMGYDNPVQINQMLHNEALQLARQAVEQGVEPAEMAYRIAHTRGYVKKASKLDNVEKGQQRTKSLSNVGGQEERVPDIEAIANMTDEDFAKAVAGGNWEKLFA